MSAYSLSPFEDSSVFRDTLEYEPNFVVSHRKQERVRVRKREKEKNEA